MYFVKLVRMAIAVLVILTAFGAASPTRDASAANGLIWVSYRGVNLMALAPQADTEFDVKLVAGGQAVSRLLAALQMLLDTSPFAEAALQSLQERGDVFLVYDPGYPTKPTVDVLGERLAKFRPNLFDNADELTDSTPIPVVIGRYLIKWPRKQIAAVLAREVFGYGAQHADGRSVTIADRDARCEAGLYGEKAHQDLGSNKRSGLMVRIRQELEWRWCSGFKQFIHRRQPAEMALWKQLNPDIPRLLALFSDYVSAPDYPAAQSD
jgi:hypothetical protein